MIALKRKKISMGVSLYIYIYIYINVILDSVHYFIVIYRVNI
jgi:hypothetical protein